MLPRKACARPPVVMKQICRKPARSQGPASAVVDGLKRRKPSGSYYRALRLSRRREVKAAEFYDTCISTQGGYVRTFLDERGGLWDFYMFGIHFDFDSVPPIWECGRWRVGGKYRLECRERRLKPGEDGIRGDVPKVVHLSDAVPHDALSTVNNSIFGILTGPQVQSESESEPEAGVPPDAGNTSNSSTLADPQ